MNAIVKPAAALVRSEVHPAEWEVVEDAPPAGTLNETIAHLVKQVQTPNGAPICIFMPLVEAVLAKQAMLHKRREGGGADPSYTGELTTLANGGAA